MQCEMQDSIIIMLRNVGLTDETISVIKDEMILTIDIFKSLEREHFSQLLPKLKVGQHSLLVQLWMSLEEEEQQEVYTSAIRVSNRVSQSTA